MSAVIHLILRVARRGTAAACAVAVLLAPGCSKSPEAPAPASGPTAAGSEPVTGIEYSAKNGLRVPEALRKAIDLRVADVTERRMTSRLQFQAALYEVRNGTGRAVAGVDPNLASRLPADAVLEMSGPGGVKLEGRVVRRTSMLQAATGETELLLEIPGLPASATAGDTWTAAWLQTTKDPVIVLPRSALVGCAAGHFAYTVNGDHFIRTPLRLGSGDAEAVEVVDGLLAGDQVVVSAAMTLWLTELHNVNGGDLCCPAADHK